MNSAEPQQPQGADSDLQKLEQDLKSLEQEAQTASVTTPEPQSAQEVQQPVATAPTTPPSLNTEIPINPPVNFPTQPEKPKKNFPLMSIAIILVAVALLATVAYVVGMQFFGTKSVSSKACTTEAKVCPDGSSVGREGPNCDFAACPTVTSTPDPTANWQTYTNVQYGFELKYPATYSQIQDKTKYPNSILILSSDGKLYDLVIEVWNSTKDMAKAYPTTSGNLSSMSLGGSSILTFLKSGNPEIDQVISTFKFTSATSSVNPSPTSSASVMPAGY